MFRNVKEAESAIKTRKHEALREALPPSMNIMQAEPLFEQAVRQSNPDALQILEERLVSKRQARDEHYHREKVRHIMIDILNRCPEAFEYFADRAQYYQSNKPAGGRNLIRAIAAADRVQYLEEHLPNMDLSLSRESVEGPGYHDVLVGLSEVTESIIQGIDARAVLRPLLNDRCRDGRLDELRCIVRCSDRITYSDLQDAAAEALKAGEYPCVDFIISERSTDHPTPIDDTEILTHVADQPDALLKSLEHYDGTLASWDVIREYVQNNPSRECVEGLVERTNYQALGDSPTGDSAIDWAQHFSTGASSVFLRPIQTLPKELGDLPAASLGTYLNNDIIDTLC